jgi:hypothetical protein
MGGQGGRRQGRRLDGRAGRSVSGHGDAGRQTDRQPDSQTDRQSDKAREDEKSERERRREEKSRGE